MSETNAIPMNMAFQFPNCVMIMGMGDDRGIRGRARSQTHQKHARILAQPWNQPHTSTI